MCAANYPGAGKAVPQVASTVNTLITGVSVPVGQRTAAIIGLGAREEIIIANAVGKGNDGLNPTYTSTNGSDGRHFIFGAGADIAPLVSNRTQLFKDGSPLRILEGTIDGNPFSNVYDAKVDPTLARIELQRSSLVDQGGSYFSAGASNVGDGYILSLSLVDANAPAETWTIRCSSVRRDAFGVPIDGYARFIARGSVSGLVLDGYGNQVIWQSNGVIVSNGILSFAISEGSIAFREGDSFLIRTQNGALIAGDSLTAVYISEGDLNDPQFFSDIRSLGIKHGSPSTSNTISLGAQLAWTNGTPGVFAIEAAPAVPRRISYPLVESADGHSDIDDLTFALSLGVTPDSASNINFFVTDPITKIESQIIPNKVSFFDPAYTANPSLFVFGGAHAYSYTVVKEASIQKAGLDGVIKPTGPTTGTLASATVQFGQDDISITRQVVIFDAINPGNNGTFSVISVANGIVTLNNPSGFTAETGVPFQVADSSTQSCQILWTSDLALSLGQSLRATIVDEKDANFYDAGWILAYGSAETIDTNMIVPLPTQTISVIFQNGKAHVEKMSNIKNKKERMLFIGAISGLTPDNVIGTVPAAVEDIGILEGIQGDTLAEILAGNDEDLANYGVQSAYGDSFRVVYFYPDQIVVQVGSDRLLIDGFYLAAAAAGRLSSDANIEEPLTNKTIGGFTILRDKQFSPTIIENISAAGIALLQPVSGGGLVIWSKTTTISGVPEEEEMSIVFIRDAVAQAVRGSFLQFIGKAETPTLQATLYQVADAAFQSFISRKWITQFKDVTVQRDSVEPRQWNVTAAVQPTYGVNWIYIVVNLGRLA